jgi:uncharacterized surface protein with fasciclin (FAS1) repeats
MLFRIIAATALTVAMMTGATTLSAQQVKKDIVDTAVSHGSFKTLAAALTAADLIDSLKAEGPFTVFAPTGAAFDKLPRGTVEELLKPKNKKRLIAVLTYHVVPGNVMAKEVQEMTGAKTLNGQCIDITVNGRMVKVDGAKVSKTDVTCSNGVIHAIDRVMLPAEQNIVETAEQAGKFKTLLAAAEAAGLIEHLSGDDEFTLFAPTDQAFADLPKGTVASLLEPKNKKKLAAILKYHVVAGRVYSDDAMAAETAETLHGDELQFEVSGRRAKVNQANLVKTNIDATNGVIHIIDKVLMPDPTSGGSQR